MTIYVAHAGIYSDRRIIGVYSNRGAAELHSLNRNMPSEPYADVEEWDIDNEVPNSIIRWCMVAVFKDGIYTSHKESHEVIRGHKPIPVVSAIAGDTATVEGSDHDAVVQEYNRIVEQARKARLGAGH